MPPKRNHKGLRNLHPLTRKHRHDDAFQREMFRKSPALAFANSLLHGKAEEEPSLADRFIAMTYAVPDQFSGRPKRIMLDTLMQYRIDMRHSHRFVLDDQFVEMATHVATAPAEKTLARLQYATLPYDTTWIEFNLRAKVRAIRQIHKVNDTSMESIATRCGMLLQRINDTDAVCTLVDDVDGMINTHVSAYFFSTVETDFVLQNRAHFGCNPMVLRVSDAVDKPSLMQVNKRLDDEVRKDVRGDSTGKACLWGYSANGEHGMVGADVSNLQTPVFLQRHGDIGTSRAYEAYRASFDAHPQMKDKVTELLLSELKEFTGHMRWVATVLAMLNEVPVHAEHVVPSHQMKVGHFKKHNLVDYHRVTLRLPKKNPIAYYERHLRDGPERRHRAHEVRAHWRTYLHPEHCKYDEHAWEYDHDEGYRLCGRCMAYSRLIHEHIRGNAELGWVRKDYLIKPSNQ